MDQRFQIAGSVYEIATLLLPEIRERIFGSLKQAQIDDRKKTFVEEVALVAGKQQHRVEPELESVPKKRKLDELLGGALPIPSRVADPIAVECQNFLDHRSELEVTEFWQQNETRYPNIAILARQLLCLPVASTSIERIFSSCGRVNSPRRSKLKPENLANIVFLKKNLPTLEALQAGGLVGS